MTNALCPGRFADYTDTTHCGEPMLPGHSLCIAHRVQRLTRLRRRIAEEERELATLRAQYDALFREGQPPIELHSALEYAEAIESDAARRCAHSLTQRGAEIPRRYGSYRSLVCRACGAFRATTHQGEQVPGQGWRPASEYIAVTSTPIEEG